MSNARSPFGPRRSRSLAVVTVAALLSTISVGGARAATPCASPPPVFPLSEVRPGMTAVGYTTVQGQTPVTFTVEIDGIMPGFMFPDIDVIVGRITGPPDFLASAGGMFSGMSGSPVYVDGRLLGATSWGADIDRTWTGITPAEEMVKLLGLPSGLATSLSQRSVALTPQTRRAVSRSAGVPLTTIPTELVSLPLPLGVSGLPQRELERLQVRLDERGESFRVVRASAASVPTVAALNPSPIQPGAPVASLIASGDYTVALTGTATAICGDRELLYGHPLFFDPPGATALGFAEATVIQVLGGPLFGTELASVGPLHGTVVQDRYTGEVAVVGQMPTIVPVTSQISSPDTGSTRSGETDINFAEGYWVPEIGFGHAYINFASVWQQSGPGTLRIDWTIEGTRADGSPWRVRNSSMAYSKWWAFDNLWMLYATLSALAGNRWETLSFSGIELSGLVSERQLDAKIVRVRASSPLQPQLRPRTVLRAKPGDRIRVEVTLRETDGASAVEVLRIRVPRGARGEWPVKVRGGRAVDYSSVEAHSFDQLVSALNAGEHTNDLIVEGFRTTAVASLDLMVEGKSSFRVAVVR